MTIDIAICDDDSKDLKSVVNILGEILPHIVTSAGCNLFILPQIC